MEERRKQREKAKSEALRDEKYIQKLERENERVNAQLDDQC